MDRMFWLAVEAGETQAAEELKQNVSALWKAVESQLPALGKFAWHVFLAILFWFVGKRLIAWAMKLLQKYFDKRGTEISVRKFMEMLVRWVLYALLIFQIISLLGVNTASIIALLGSAGLAVGLAVQGSLANFAGGVLILVLKPFAVGDYIVDKSGVEGTVTMIGLFYTKLSTVDNKQVTVPNGDLANGTITNVAAQENRRIVIKVGISYGADLKKAKEIMYRIMTEREKVLQDQEKMVVVNSLDESCVTLLGRVWVRTEDYWPEYWSMMEEVKLAFDEAGIEIPYNQLDVHIRQESREKEEQ